MICILVYKKLKENASTTFGVAVIERWWPHTPPVACVEVATLPSRLPWARESQWIGYHGMRPLV